MANIIKISKSECEKNITRQKKGGAVNGNRKGTLQGALLTVSSEGNLPHSGGGARGEQCGHDWRSENAISKFLWTCIPAKYFISLTFPTARGPEDCKKVLKKFRRNLKYKYDYSAAIKMEVQPGRMSGEFMMLIWTAPHTILNKQDIQRLWNNSIDENARIQFAKVDKKRWLRLAKYFSKKVLIRPAVVTVDRL